MTRKRVLTARVTEPQLEFLWHEAGRLDITVGELVRRIIDRYREGGNEHPSIRWLQSYGRRVKGSTERRD